MSGTTGNTPALAEKKFSNSQILEKKDNNNSKHYKSMKETKICVIGLGYVGLPLARLFSTKYKTVGFDMNQKRCDALMAGHDATLEVADDILQDAINNHGFVCTSDIEQIKDCNFYIVAVPTPVDDDNNPDLTPLVGASTTVGKVISKGDVVVYESTVYPGVTEDDCIPVVEKVSGLKMNVDFYGGYSPERINPGDKQHTVEHIKKVTSGSTPEIGKYINEVYSSVITAGTHLAPTIKVAEAAKVIENSQRDINIAFVNELSKIFNKMGIDTLDVLEAAGTKWNFLPFRPGLVGGHCIGVDPYYLAQCAQRHGYILVVRAVELAARVEDREHHLDRGTVLRGMHVHGDAASVVRHGERAVRIDLHVDERAVPRERLVDRVVHHLVHEMVVPAFARIADVHGRALAHGLHALQHLDVGGIVLARLLRRGGRFFDRLRLFF